MRISRVRAARALGVEVSLRDEEVSLHASAAVAGGDTLFEVGIISEGGADQAANNCVAVHAHELAVIFEEGVLARTASRACGRHAP